MRLTLFALFLLIFGFTALVTAQQADDHQSGVLLQTTDGDTDQMVNGVWVPTPLERVADPFATRGRAVNAGNDTCNMTTDNLPAFGQVGTIFTSSDATQVNGFTEDVADPDLATCIFQAQTVDSTTGYRTAWYRFTASATGDLNIRLISANDYNDNFDTVLALYEADSCGAVATSSRLTCNDDRNGLLSEIDAQVTQGQTYFVEIADRNPSVKGVAVAHIIVQVETEPQHTTNTAWSERTSEEPNAWRSRHSTVVIDNEIYVFGGQTSVGLDVPVRTNSVTKFNPATGKWTALTDMPPQCDPNGYSNTTAAFVTNTTSGARRVYLPAGFVGTDGDYRGVHCIYDVATNSWTFDAVNTAPWSTGRPAIYSVGVGQANRYFVAGGLDGQWPLILGASFTVLDDTLSYDVRANTWTVWDEMNTPRMGHTGVLLGNLFCVVGGIKYYAPDSVQVIPDGECLDTSFQLNEWGATVPALNTPRFNAASYVDNNGIWYIFGGVGVNDNFEPVLVGTTERYNPYTNSWEVLDDRYSIAPIYANVPPMRAWMRGGVVNGQAYLIGGETDIDGIGNGDVTGIVTQFTFPAPPQPIVAPPSTIVSDIYLPIVMNDFRNYSLHTQAAQLAVGQTRSGDFNDNVHRFDVYEFRVTSRASHTLTLSNIPASDDYDLLLLSQAKLQLASSANVGTANETITQTLDPGIYFVIVVVNANQPLTTGSYQLKLTN